MKILIKNKNLIIFGTGEFGQIAHDYFNKDSEFEVVAFTLEKEYINENILNGLPVIPFEEIESHYEPDSHYIFVAITYKDLNQLRKRFYQKSKEKGFKIASYISSQAYVGPNVEIGENCFVFENSVIQYNTKIGNNVIMWSNGYIGDHATIQDNCFLAACAVVACHCHVEENCFLGLNCTVVDHKKLAKNTLLGAGAVLIKDTQEGMAYAGNPAHPIKSSFEVNICNDII